MSDKEQVMYVWEVRENGGYDGIYWTVLVKDDSEALGKIKKILLNHLNDCHDYDLIAKSQITVVESLTELPDYLELEKRYDSLEVTKVEVI